MAPRESLPLAVLLATAVAISAPPASAERGHVERWVYHWNLDDPSEYWMFVPANFRHPEQPVLLAVAAIVRPRRIAATA